MDEFEKLEKDKTIRRSQVREQSSSLNQVEFKNGHAQSILPLVSIVIPSLNAADILPTCIESLLNQSYRNVEIILVDNGSTDGSSDLVHEKYPSVKVFRSEENLGYSGGCNLGASIGKGKYLLFCDNDISVNPESISELVKEFEQCPQIGIAQSKMLLASDPTIIESMGGYFTGTGILYQEERDLPNGPDKDVKHEIFGAKGAFMMIPRELYFEIGGFDDEYVAYFEDTDISWRAWLAGLKVIVVPSSVVIHGRSVTTKRLASDFVLYHSSKNRICTLIKYLGVKDIIRVLPVHLLLTIIGILISLLTFKLINAIALCKAILWNVRNLDKSLQQRRAANLLKKDSAIHPLPRLRRRMPVSYLISSGKNLIGI